MFKLATTIWISSIVKPLGSGITIDKILELATEKSAKSVWKIIECVGTGTKGNTKWALIDVSNWRG